MNRWLLLALVASLGLSACSKKEEPAAAAPAGGHPAISAQMPNQGKALQIQNAAGYTYAEVEMGNGQKVWIAGAQLDVKAGDTLQWGDAAVMRGFTSKTLGRTFDEILFVNAWAPAGGAAAQVAPHGAMPGQPMQVAALPAAGAGNSGIVKTATNAGGYSYLEVDQGGTTIWVAAPETAVKAGDKVVWDGGSTMHNFNAKSLNRTFEQIVFAGSVSIAK